MSFAAQALATFRRGSDAAFGGSPLPAVFVMEPGMFATNAVTSSWCPVASMQTLDGTGPSGIGAVRDTIDHAVRCLGARTVVVCGEGTVRPDQSKDRERLLTACLALLEDAALGQTLRSRAVTIEVLWFDTVDGDIYRWDTSTRRFELLADEGLSRFLSEVRQRAVSAPAEAAASA